MSFLKRKSRGSFQPICSEHRIPAYYLGKHAAKGKVGLSVVQSPVATLYSQFREVTGKRVLLEVQNEGLWVKHTGEGSGGRLVRRHTVEKGSNLANRTNNAFTIPVNDISFGAVDSNHRKVFAIVVRKTDEDETRTPWECHAFLCNSHSDAKHMTLNLVAAFQKNAQSDVGSKSSPTTMHVFTESLSPKYQRGSSSKGNVTTLKLTFNVEQIDTPWSEPSEYNRNKHISKILSERESPKLTKADSIETERDINSQPSNNSDKENEGSDTDVLEVTTSSKSRTSLVAVNTGLTELTAVQEQEDGAEEEDAIGSFPDGVPEAVQEPSPKQSRTQQKPKKKKMVRFIAEIDYIE